MGSKGRNAFMVALRELQGSCKIRGSFLTGHQHLCNNEEHPIDFSLIENDVPARLLMKAISITVHGLSAVSRGNVENVLFNRTNERLNQTYYDYMLTGTIPQTLESKDRDNGMRPFLDQSTDDQSYGDGRAGYLLWQIRATDNTLSKFKYEMLQDIKLVDVDVPLDLSDKTIEFYSNGETTSTIKSYSSRCNGPTTPPSIESKPISDAKSSVTVSPVSNDQIQNTIIIIILCVVNVILFIAGFFIIRMFLKKGMSLST